MCVLKFMGVHVCPHVYRDTQLTQRLLLLLSTWFSEAVSTEPKVCQHDYSSLPAWFCSLCLHLLFGEWELATTVTWYFRWVLGMQTPVYELCNKYFAQWNIFPDNTIKFSKLYSCDSYTQVLIKSRRYNGNKDNITHRARTSRSLIKTDKTQNVHKSKI